MAHAKPALPETNIQRIRRDEIETAALRTVLRHGFAGTSLRTVAKESNVPLAVIHHYFRNKDVLMRRPATRIFDAMMANFAAVRAHYRDPVRRSISKRKTSVRAVVPIRKRRMED